MQAGTAERMVALWTAATQNVPTQNEQIRTLGACAKVLHVGLLNVEFQLLESSKDLFREGQLQPTTARKLVLAAAHRTHALTERDTFFPSSAWC
jgi:hypothetical protein